MDYIQILLIFIAQIVFNILKVLEVKYTYQNKKRALLINTVWINLVALVTVYLSIKDMLEGKWYIALFYIGGAVIGKWIGMQLDNSHNTIWRNIFKHK